MNIYELSSPIKACDIYLNDNADERPLWCLFQ